MSRLRANQITNENANGAPNFPHGLTVTGVVTATTSATSMSQIVVGSAVTANSNGVDTVGIVTAGTFKDKAGGTFAPNPTTTRGDVIVRGVSVNERLAIGSAGQVLKVNAGANGLEYGAAGTIRQHKIISKTTKSSITGTTPTIIPDFSITITPTASDSIMVVEANMFYSINTHVILTRIYKDSDIIIQPAAYDGNDDGSSSYYVSNEDRMTQQHITAFETAGNTNARTYNVYWNVSSGTGYINRYNASDSYNSVSTLRVTEVAP